MSHPPPVVPGVPLQPIAPHSMRWPSGLNVMRTSDCAVETTSGAHSCAGLTKSRAQANGAAFMGRRIPSATALGTPLLFELLRILVRSCLYADKDGALAHGRFVFAHAILRDAPVLERADETAGDADGAGSCQRDCDRPCEH